MSKDRVLFLDETAVKLNEAPMSTLVVPGESAYVIVADNTSYAARYDMIVCCSGDHVMPPMIITPADRAAEGVSGLTREILRRYIRDVLGQAVAVIDKYPITLFMDRASIHSTDLLQEFWDVGCQDLAKIQLLPTHSAKRMSPLDNALFHDWKEAIRKRSPITKGNIEQLMADEWNNIPKEKIQAQYRHCGLTTAKAAYFDCPEPAVHHHGS